jgi:LmbE family N-acetylglucosaminyl deacetylase
VYQNRPCKPQQRRAWNSTFSLHTPYAEQHLTRSSYDYIYLSPHLDDVALSCSGTLCRQHAQGLNILVVTLFAGEPQLPFSPFSQSVHRSWHAPQERPYQVRKEEERKAMALLGTDYVWLDWLEILYRDPELADANDFFWEPGTSVVHARDAALFAALCAWVADASQVYPGAQVVAPLGLGMHRDHQFVFQAALTTLAGDRVLFFEDFPYATYYSQDELIGYVQSYNMSCIEVDISEYLEQRIAVSEVYQSQIPTFFYTASSFRELIRMYTLQTGKQQHPIERYWRRLR